MVGETDAHKEDQSNKAIETKDSNDAMTERLDRIEEAQQALRKDFEVNRMADREYKDGQSEQLL